MNLKWSTSSALIPKMGFVYSIDLKSIDNGAGNGIE